MKLRPIGIVYLKEMRDLLRDRRTIMSMIVVPVLVLPALMIAITSMASKVVGQARQEVGKVMLLGGEDSPETVAALRELKTIRIVAAAADYTNQISDKKIGAAVEIPQGFDAALKAGATTSAVRIYTYESELKSTIAAEGLEQFFRKRKEAIVSQRLEERHIPQTVLTPFSVTRTNVASPKKVTGNTVGMILPYMVILMCLAGAIYPSVDLTAGEKERGTLETLLCSPVARTHLVVAKGMVVLTVSLVTAVLSISSNGGALLVMKRAPVGEVKGALLTSAP